MQAGLRGAETGCLQRAEDAAQRPVMGNLRLHHHSDLLAQGRQLLRLQRRIEEG